MFVSNFLPALLYSHIYMQLWKQFALPVITTMALWQLMYLGTWCTVYIYYWYMYIYIYIYTYIYIIYIYKYIYIYIYTYIYVYIYIYYLPSVFIHVLPFINYLKMTLKVQSSTQTKIKPFYCTKFVIASVRKIRKISSVW